MNSETIKKSQKSRFVLPIFLCFAGIALGWFGCKIASDENSSSSTHGLRQGGYTFINPLLECDVDAEFGSRTLRPLESAIEEYAESSIAGHAVSHVSIYYRDLNNGPWFGINQDETFTPASLLKVPVMMTYFRAADSDRHILEDTAIYDSPSLNTSNQLTVNETYTIEQLIKYMIRDSDNDAFTLLVEHIDSDLIDKTLQDLGLVVPNETTPEDYITVRSYASLFRVLFNASYLSRDMSEKALELLSTSTYADGLRAGVPDEIIVASKFGIRGNQGDPERQLHDCGIIYYPDHPYLLCVMTRGDDLNKLSTTIGNISKTVYDYSVETFSK